MKWQAAEKGWTDYLSEWWSGVEHRMLLAKEARMQWHAKYAWLPRSIPKAVHEQIVVPRHWVWLEYYEYRYKYGEASRRPYTGCPTFRVRLEEARSNNAS